MRLGEEVLRRLRPALRDDHQGHSRSDPRDRDQQVRLAAEIRRSGADRLIPGDFLTTVAVPWTVDQTEGNSIPVTQV